MKKILLPSLALLAVLASSAQAQSSAQAPSREFSDVPAGSWQYSAIKQLLEIEGLAHLWVEPSTRYEFAVALYLRKDKYPSEENLLPISKMGDIWLALNREFADELRRLPDALKFDCMRTTIIEKLPKPAPIKDQVSTTFLRRKVEK